MMTNVKEKAANNSILFNRVLYGLFVLLSIYFLASKDIENAMSNLGIALIFDPFDQKITWRERPIYQRAWLLVHLSIVLGLVVILIANRFG